MRRGAQQRAQLHAEQVLCLQAQPDRTQAQRGVVRRGATQAPGIDLLVGAQVQRADGDRPADGLNDIDVGGVLLGLAGQFGAVHVQEFRPVQAHAGRAHAVGMRGVGGQLDIAQQRDLGAVAGDGGHVAQRLEHGAEALMRLRAALELGALGRTGRGNGLTGLAVDQDQLAFLHLRRGAVGADNGRDV